jgi:hypothetical protein
LFLFWFFCNAFDDGLRGTREGKARQGTLPPRPQPPKKLLETDCTEFIRVLESWPSFLLLLRSMGHVSDVWKEHNWLTFCLWGLALRLGIDSSLFYLVPLFFLFFLGCVWRSWSLVYDCML